MFRLACYADARYQEVVAVLCSPEHATRLAIVASKRREIEVLRARLDSKGARAWHRGGRRGGGKGRTHGMPRFMQ